MVLKRLMWSGDGRVDQLIISLEVYRGCATMQLCNCVIVRLSNCEIVQIGDCATVWLCDCATVQLWDTATVRLWYWAIMILINYATLQLCDYVCKCAIVRLGNCETEHLCKVRLSNCAYVGRCCFVTALLCDCATMRPCYWRLAGTDDLAAFSKAPTFNSFAWNIPTHTIWVFWSI